MTDRDLAIEARGWRPHADELAAFALHLANRVDVYGAYVAPSRRQPDRPATWTAPAVDQRGRVVLGSAQLARHFRARHGGDTIGLHTTSPANTSVFFGIDFDAHGAPTTAQLMAVHAALDWMTDALGERVSLLIEDSDGGGSFHLWGRFDHPVETAALFVWLTAVAIACESATGIRPETYPKQARLPVTRDGTQGFGNWLRLWGLHHTKPHWSRVCRPGESFVGGADAAQLILHRWPATPADAVPPVDSWPADIVEAVRPIPDPPRLARELPASRARAIEAYVLKVPHGDAGSCRSDRLFQIACFLRYDMQCSASEAIPIMGAWNTGNTPPLPDWKLADTWQNAAKYGGRRVA